MIGSVLVIDTATAAVTAAVVRRDSAGSIAVMGECVLVDARAHAERLTPNVLTALGSAGLAMAELNAVVVGCGPGPFTGLRVGMATGAAFGQALGIPVYGVCSLDGIGSQTTGDVLVVTDARRREVYWAQYCNGVRIAGPSVNAAADVPRGDAVAVAGSGPQAELFDLPMIGPEYPRPEGLVSAVNDWSQNPPPLLPLYLRRPDAKTLAERARQ